MFTFNLNTSYKNKSKTKQQELINMFNKNWCPPIAVIIEKSVEDFSSRCMGSRWGREVRVPTVSEKQIDRIRNEAKHRPQIYVGGKYKVVYIDDARQLIVKWSHLPVSEG